MHIHTSKTYQLPVLHGIQTDADDTFTLEDQVRGPTTCVCRHEEAQTDFFVPADEIVVRVHMAAPHDQVADSYFGNGKQGALHRPYALGLGSYNGGLGYRVRRWSA